MALQNWMRCQKINFQITWGIEWISTPQTAWATGSTYGDRNVILCTSFLISEWKTVIFKLLSFFYVYAMLFKFIKNKFKHSLHVTDAWCKFFNAWGQVFISVFIIFSDKLNKSDCFICYHCFFFWHVKSSTSKLNILQATTVKNVGVLIAGNYLQEDVSMYVLDVDINYACLQEHSFRIANWTCISCCLACLSSSLPTKVSVQWRCVLSWM